MTEPTNPNTIQSIMAQLAANEADRPAETPMTARERRARTIARLSAVQALYQMELAGEGVETVIREFSDHRFDGALEDETMAEADEPYFADLVRGVVEDQGKVDEAVMRRLAEGWKLTRLDATLRALLRTGTWELMHKPDTPREVVLDEYVELAKAFFDERDARFVNAALDGVARDVRG